MPLLSAVIDAATGADREVVAAVVGSKIRVFGWIATNGTAGTFTWKTAATAKTGAIPFDANGGGAPFFAGGIFETAYSEALNLNVSAGTAKGIVTYALIRGSD